MDSATEDAKEKITYASLISAMNADVLAQDSLQRLGLRWTPLHQGERGNIFRPVEIASQIRFVIPVLVLVGNVLVTSGRRCLKTNLPGEEVDVALEGLLSVVSETLLGAVVSDNYLYFAYDKAVSRNICRMCWQEQRGALRRREGGTLCPGRCRAKSCAGQ